MKFCYGLCDGLVRSLWDRIRAKANTGNFVVGIYCRSQSQEDKTDETSLDMWKNVTVSSLVFYGSYQPI